MHRNCGARWPFEVEGVGEVTPFEDDVREPRRGVPATDPRVRCVRRELHYAVGIGPVIEFPHTVGETRRWQVVGAARGQDVNSQAALTRPSGKRG